MPTYVRDSGVWKEVSGGSLPEGSTFPSGTLMLFQQTASPTGWTKQTTHNNKALRVVSGTASSGGNTVFTSVFGNRTPAGSNSGGGVSAHTLSWNEMPSHQHYAYAPNNDREDSLSQGWPSGNNHQSFRSSDRGRSYAIALDAIGGAGSNWSHAHGFTNPTFTGTAMDFDVQYVDLIIASKN